MPPALPAVAQPPALPPVAQPPALPPVAQHPAPLLRTRRLTVE